LRKKKNATKGQKRKFFWSGLRFRSFFTKLNKIIRCNLCVKVAGARNWLWPPYHREGFGSPNHLIQM